MIKKGIILTVLVGLFFICVPCMVYFFSTWWAGPGYSIMWSHSSSTSKKRGTYVCSLRPIDPLYIFSDSIKFEISEGWVEKGWWNSDYNGPVSIDTTVYSILLKPMTYGERITKLSIYNPKYNSYLEFKRGLFHTEISILPDTDSLEYYVFKEDNAHFDLRDIAKNHIIDSFYVVLDRKPG